MFVCVCVCVEEVLCVKGKKKRERERRTLKLHTRTDRMRGSRSVAGTSDFRPACVSHGSCNASSALERFAGLIRRRVRTNFFAGSEILRNSALSLISPLRISFCIAASITFSFFLLCIAECPNGACPVNIQCMVTPHAQISHEFV